MATWITHLRVAEQVNPGLRGIEYQYFLIGSLAPDAGKLNDDRKTYTPPATVSHFRGTDPQIPWCESLVFHRRYLTANIQLGNATRTSFELGYFIHLVLDNLWSYYVLRPARIKYEAQFSNDPMFVWKMKKDWYGIDREFLIERPQWPTWREFLGAEYSHDYLDFYPREIIHQKMESIKEFYLQTEKPNRPGIYLDHNTMDSFVRLSAHWVKELMDLVEASGSGGHTTERTLLSQHNDAFLGPMGDLAADYASYIATTDGPGS